MISVWIYASHALIASRSAEEGTLYLRARANNRANDITGHLHRSGERYVQVVEGEADAVAALRRRIERDWRHDGLVTLREGTVRRRSFADWEMGFTDMEDAPAPLVTLLADPFGAEPGALHAALHRMGHLAQRPRT